MHNSRSPNELAGIHFNNLFQVQCDGFGDCKELTDEYQLRTLKSLE